MRKTKRLHGLGLALAIFVIVIAAAVLITVVYEFLICGRTLPIFTKNSIAEYEDIELGGNMQSVLIRGEDKSNPVLLYIHGGPGNPETSFIVPFQSEWEKRFTVVNWDQLGSGRSYDGKLKNDNITTDRLVSDALELTEKLKEKFGVEKIYLMGHSFGTLVGMRCINEKPEDFYAYIGTGQIGNMTENEGKVIAYAKESAEKDGNSAAVKQLEALGDGVYTRDNFFDGLKTSRKWSTYYGGAMYGRSDVLTLYAIAFFRPEYSAFDFFDYFSGVSLYYTQSSNDSVRWDLYSADLLSEIPEVKVPVCFIQGADDYTTTCACCEEYFDALSAPYKKLYKIENAAHNVIAEKNSEFNHRLMEFVDEIEK